MILRREINESSICLVYGPGGRLTSIAPTCYYHRLCASQFLVSVSLFLSSVADRVLFDELPILCIHVLVIWVKAWFLFVFDVWIM